MNPAELNYQAVSTFDGSEQQQLTDARRRSEFSRMEPGKKYRQFLAGVLGIVRCYIKIIQNYSYCASIRGNLINYLQRVRAIILQIDIF